LGCQNVHELAGIDPETRQIDQSRAIAPALIESYRGHPSGHPPGVEHEKAYYDRQVAWLKETLRELRDERAPSEPPPPGQSEVRRAAAERVVGEQPVKRETRHAIDQGAQYARLILQAELQNQSKGASAEDRRNVYNLCSKPSEYSS
jgi:hypothetical protein